MLLGYTILNLLFEYCLVLGYPGNFFFFGPDWFRHGNLVYNTQVVESLVGHFKTFRTNSNANTFEYKMAA